MNEQLTSNYQEYLNYYFWSNFIFLIIWLLAIGLTVFFTRKLYKAYKYSGDEVGITIIGILLFLIFFLLACGNVGSLIKVRLYPKAVISKIDGAMKD